METPEGRARFECPADFCPCPFSPGSGFSQESLRSPSKQLWLIRAPANFRPESLDGHAVPLLGSQMLKASQPDGTRKVYSFQAVPGDLDTAHLLIPSSHQDRLTCAPPFSGLLSVCERFGDPGADRPLFPVEAQLAPQIPAGLRQRFLPFGGHPQGSAVREVAEGPPRKKKKKKKHELHTLGYMGAPEEPLSPQHKPCPRGPSAVHAEVFVAPAEAGGLQEERKSRKHRHREVAQSLPEQGSQPSSSLEGSSQASLSGGLTDTSCGSRKKRKKEKQQKEEVEGWLPEPSSLPQQPGLEKTWAAEELVPSKTKKKKKRRQEEEEEAAVASVDVASTEQEAEGGQGDFQGPEAILEGSLGESLPTGRHKKKKKKEKVVVEEPEAGALLLVPSPVQIDLVDWAEQGPEQEVPGKEETSQKHKKKKKKHKKEAAGEESQPA